MVYLLVSIESFYVQNIISNAISIYITIITIEIIIIHYAFRVLCTLYVTYLLKTCYLLANIISNGVLYIVAMWFILSSYRLIVYSD